MLKETTFNTKTLTFLFSIILANFLLLIILAYLIVGRALVAV